MESRGQEREMQTLEISYQGGTPWFKTIEVPQDSTDSQIRKVIMAAFNLRSSRGMTWKAV